MTFIFHVLFSLFVLPSFSGHPQHVSTASESPTATDTQQEIAILQAQLQTTRIDNERLLSTVHWSLATIAGIGFLMIGFGWLANFRFYERDKSSMYVELKALLSAEISRINEGVNDKVQQAVSHTSDLLKSSSEQWRQALESELSQKLGTLQAEIGTTRRQIANVRYYFAKDKAEECESKRATDNALGMAVEMLELSLIEGNEYHIVDSLNLLLRYLNLGAMPAPSRSMSLDRLLPNVPDPNRALAGAVADALAKRRSLHGNYPA